MLWCSGVDDVCDGVVWWWQCSGCVGGVLDMGRVVPLYCGCDYDFLMQGLTVLVLHPEREEMEGILNTLDATL